MHLLKKAVDFFVPKLRHALHFFVNQGIAVAGNLIYGLICVRLLPVDSYAQFAIIFGFMATLTVLMDSVTTGTLAPLVGERTDDLHRIADFVASSRRITMRVFFFLAPFAAVTLFLILKRQPWSLSVDLQIVIAVLIISWFARVGGTYSAVLLIRRDRIMFYRIQIIGSIGSLAALLLLWALHRINIYVCVLLNISQVIVCAYGFYRRAYTLLGTRGNPSPIMQRGIVHLALPSVPGSVFYAIQGQITLLLITVFGHSATSIANLGALARLGQILTFASQMNPVLIEPFFAKLRASHLKRIYLATIFLFAVGLAFFSASAFLYPEVFLWLIGPHYRELRVEAGMVVLAASLQFMGGLLHVIHTARRFVYWWNNIANIILVLLVQVIFIWKSNLSTVRSVLMLSIATAIASLIVSSSVGVFGFVFGPQKALRGLDTSVED